MNTHDVSERARRLHFSSLVFDTHVDTPQRFLFEDFDLSSRDILGNIDLPRMREAGLGAVFFALWVPVELRGAIATRRALGLLDRVAEQIRLHSDELAFAKCADDVRLARAQGKIAVLIGVEGGHAIDNKLDVLDDLFARGVRYMTLTHNAATDWADASTQSARHGGLTQFGAEVIGQMNRLGMLIDISHVSDATFYDVLKTSQAPVIASHSCCRAICDAPRNLSDAMIKDLAQAGGVMHITFHKAFLSQEYTSARKMNAGAIQPREELISQTWGANEARKLIALQGLDQDLTHSGTLPVVHCEKIVEHIDHAVSLVGPNHVGLGSDFDGAYMPVDMSDVTRLPQITEALLRRGYAENAIRGILGETTLRVMGDCERVAHELQTGKG